MATATCVL